MKSISKRFFVTFVLTCAYTLLSAGEFQKFDTTVVKSIEGIIKAPLEIISGEAGKSRDWDAFKSLFLPDAHFTVVQHIPNKTTQVQSIPIDKFIELVGPLYKKNGFLEQEIHKQINEYNGIANVFQSYYAKHLNTGKEEKGINSYQLVFEKGRWWIANILWTSDTNGVKVPEEYLKQ